MKAENKETFDYFLSYSIVFEPGDVPSTGNMLLPMDSPLDNADSLDEAKDLIAAHVAGVVGRIPFVTLFFWKRMIDLGELEED